MSDLTTDPTLDRLLRHMAWANAMLFDQLAAPAGRRARARVAPQRVDGRADRRSPRQRGRRLRGTPRGSGAPRGDRATDDGRRTRPPRRPLRRVRRPAPRPGRRPGWTGRVTGPREAPYGRARRSSASRSTTRPSIGPRSRPPSRRTGSTRSTLTPSTSGSTATPRVSGRRTGRARVSASPRIAHLTHLRADRHPTDLTNGTGRRLRPCRHSARAHRGGHGRPTRESRCGPLVRGVPARSSSPVEGARRPWCGRSAPSIVLLLSEAVRCDICGTWAVARSGRS